MSELVFYTHPQSRGRIAHWMLEEADAQYETVWMEYGAGGMKKEDYLRMNPMGKVPALRDGETVVTETAAICAHLADRFPQKNLAPPPGDPRRGAWYRWLFFVAGPLEQAVTSRAMNWQVPEGRNSMVGFGSYEDTLGTVEKALSAGAHVCGEHFTAADLYLGAMLGWGMRFGMIDKRPLFEDYVARLYARPAARRADLINEGRLETLS